MAERILRGRSASPGLAIGPLVRQMSPELSFRLGETVDPLQERARFDDALQRAREQLQALAATSDEMSAEILEFQLEVLADLSLAEETSAAIGPSAPPFWRGIRSSNRRSCRMRKPRTSISAPVPAT